MSKENKSYRVHRPGLAAEDYYLNEDGLIVFTAIYHKKRGYCCKSGCKHCPYGFERKKY